ncbi:alpha-mannosidase [Promethearchaeum syntrophicum]|uniref:Alpha-mannosidase n=1 Tax=Promethearchaeum syntrophicum TaxID=2594042 RepID=A0A5B9DCI3_9ARCH|nr:glycoside hydrolase family 38 C-terminal domain-containing protein [Candidatus Prometheoarchaeum syntrophicum]QEE16751.1 alpha-mannosidase [Candidatus Prometheoarchaeum syntrophicum]
MREINDGIETIFLEKLLYNPRNQKLWDKLIKSPLFNSGVNVFSKILGKLSHFSFHDFNIYAIPVSHLDAAWLWTVKDSVFRAYKTFKMALEHIEKYPFFAISLTSPQYFEWMEKYSKKLPSPDPDRTMWEAICYQVDQGKIELCGGSWIEPDLNIPCGEALIRQRLYGQLYYLRKFGKIAKIETLLDVFGFPNTTPQIFVKSGAEAFWTTKITWNDYTMWPFANFIWQGLDSTRLFTHQFRFNIEAFLDLGRYKVMARRPKNNNLIFNSKSFQDGEEMSPIAISGSKLATKNYSGLYELDDYLDKEYVRTLGYFYGNGDGGKGPLNLEIDFINILSKYYNIKHITTLDFFNILKKEVGEKMVIWDDEMYLENHRGTLTTQAQVKKGNRKAENLLFHAEMLWTLQLINIRDSFNPKTYHLFRKCWKYLLLNQFHDILPGSSIPEVYIRTWREHKFIIQSMKEFISNSLESYLISGKNMIYNPLPVSNSINIPVNSTYIQLNDIPPFSLQEIDPENLKELNIENPVQLKQSNNILICSNQYFVAIFGRNDGNLKEFLWKNDFESNYRPLLYSFDPPLSHSNLMNVEAFNAFNRNKGGRIKIYREEFKGNPYPAWNICKNYTQHPIKLMCEKVEIIKNSQTCLEIQATYSFLNSSYEVNYTIFHNSPILDIHTHIDLRDKEVLIKHFFPINLDTNEIICETQFGAVSRTRIPTTKMEAAKWEFSMQKWVDISDKNHGLAILNKDRYGASANRKGVSITLVRSPPYPSDFFYSHEKLLSKKDRPSHTDLVKHDFSYALYPHKGSWEDANIPEKGLAYNLPCFYFQSIEPKNRTESIDEVKIIKFPNISISEPNVILSALKPGEWMWSKNKDEKIGTNLPFTESKNKQFILTKNAEHWKWDGKHFILRVYEAHGRKTSVRINFNDFSSKFNLKSVEFVDLLERKEKELDNFEPNHFSFDIAPFEILTFRILFD